MLRNKQEELSEMNVRKEMAEKKLSNLARDNDVASEKLTVSLHNKDAFSQEFLFSTFCFFLFPPAQIGRQHTVAEAQGERV